MASLISVATKTGFDKHMFHMSIYSYLIVQFTLTNYLNEFQGLTSSNPKASSYSTGSQLPDHSAALCWLLSV